MSATLAALVLGITEGPTWGWSSARIVACFVGAVVVGAAFLRRSARHPEPVLDLTLFRSRSFSVANAATVLYAMGFFAMLLGNILFLTSVWHYSILRAGLAVTPGPLVVAVVSGPAGRVAQRIGFRTVLLVGFAFFAVGSHVVRHHRRPPPLVRHTLAAGHVDHRSRHRAHVPRSQCGGGLEPAHRTLRRRQRREPDGPPGRGCVRGGPAGGHSRHPPLTGGGPRQLPPPLGLRRHHGRVVRARHRPC